MSPHLVRNLALTLFGLVALQAHTACGQNDNSNESASALAVLRSAGATNFEKAKACQALAHVGNKDAVPALSSLLNDPELSNYARQGLEGIADASAAQALRAALGTTQGDRQIGVVASLGRKADAESVPALTKMLDSEDDRLFAAAANSLGEIATSASSAQLLSALKASAGGRSIVLAQAALKCGQQLHTRGEPKAALRIFETLSAHNPLPSHITAGVITARLALLGSEGLTILLKELQTQDPVCFQAAASSLGTIAEQLSGGEVRQILQASEQLSAERRTLIVESVSQLSDSQLADGVPEQIRRWTRENAPALQAACMRLLSRSSRSEDTQAVLDAAYSDQSIVSSAARQAIEDCADDRFDSGILGLLREQDAVRLAAGIDLAQRRRLSAATPRLEALADNPQHSARLLALTALGSTIDSGGLQSLLDRAATAKEASETREAARNGLRVAFVRLPQAECVRALAKTWQSGQGEARIYALERLADVGGPAALEILEQAVLSRDAAMQDAGSRVLGEWMSPDAAPLLLKLAQTLEDPKLKLRSLRGALRIARQLDIPLKERLSICQKALDLSSRDDERKLVLDIYRQYATPETLSASLELLSREPLREVALATAQAIAPRAALQNRSATEAVLDAAIATARSTQIKQQVTGLRQSLGSP